MSYTTKAGEVTSFYAVSPPLAFEAAILAGVLSRDAFSERFAGSFMYMGTSADRGHAFKHIETREYVYAR